MSNLSVMCHLETVNQVLKKTALRTSFMECEKAFDLVEIGTDLKALNRELSVLQHCIMDTLTKFLVS